MFIMIAGAIGVLILIAGYYGLTLFGPERWRIDARGKAAYAALEELNTSLETPIGRDEYGRCLRRAVLKVKPYLESNNAKSCPDFAEWISKTIYCYTSGAEIWNEPVAEYETTALDIRIEYDRQELRVRLRWLVAEHCLNNAKMVIEGEPGKVIPLSKDENDCLPSP